MEPPNRYWCSNHCYREVERFFPAALIQQEAASALAEIVGAIPDRADTLGFEARLTGQASAVDLGVALSTSSGGHTFLATPESDAKLSRAVRLDARWQRITDFARHWGAPESPCLERVPFLFLEFDGDGPCEPVPIPSVFAALDWPLEELTSEARKRWRVGGSAGNAGLSAAKQIVRLLRAEPPGPRADRLFDRCFVDLPDGAVILHVGVMLSRPGEGIRLSVQLPRLCARSYVERLGWGGGSKLEALLDEYAACSNFEHRASPVQLDFDVGDSIGDRIGVSLHPSEQQGWVPLLDALVRTGCCDPAKRDALLSWPGVSIAPRRGTSAWYAIEHYLAHLKISCSTREDPQAKAYFGVRPRWLSRPRS